MGLVTIRDSRLPCPLRNVLLAPKKEGSRPQEGTPKTSLRVKEVGGPW